MPNRPRFHLDENVNPALALALRQHGVEVTTSAEQELLTAGDDDQLTFATSQQRVLVTHDRDFLRMASQGTHHAGVAYCGQRKYALGDLMRALVALWASTTAEAMVNQVEFL